MTTSLRRIRRGLIWRETPFRWQGSGVVIHRHMGVHLALWHCRIRHHHPFAGCRRVGGGRSRVHGRWRGLHGCRRGLHGCRMWRLWLAGGSYNATGASEILVVKFSVFPLDNAAQHSRHDQEERWGRKKEEKKILVTINGLQRW